MNSITDITYMVFIESMQKSDYSVFTEKLPHSRIKNSVFILILLTIIAKNSYTLAPSLTI